MFRWGEIERDRERVCVCVGRGGGCPFAGERNSKGRKRSSVSDEGEMKKKTERGRQREKENFRDSFSRKTEGGDKIRM